MTDIDYQYSKDVYNTEKQVFVGNMVEMDITHKLVEYLILIIKVKIEIYTEIIY